MSASATAPATPSAVALEVQQMTAEVNTLKVGLEKAQSQLARAKNRLSSLSVLVVKQGVHLRSLGSAGSVRVVSLNDYREMRARHGGTKTAIRDANDLIGTTQKGIDDAQKRLGFLEGKLKTNLAMLDRWGKVVPMRKP